MANPNNTQKPNTNLEAQAAVAVDPGAAALAELAELKRRNAELEAKLAAAPAGLPLTPGEIQSNLDDTQIPEVAGSNIRPVRGPVHPKEGFPLFNANRPTGKAG